MKTFSGFATDKYKTVSLSDQFFTDLLPLIDDVIELKVTLACLHAFDQKAGLLKWTTIKDLENDSALKDIRASINVGLAKAVERGSILQAIDRTHETYLFLNDNYGRAAKQAVERGESVAEIPLILQRPNIFVLYEQNIGTLTPMIVEELKEAEKEFPLEWIIEAFQYAVRQNIRSWAFIYKNLKGRAARRPLKGKQEEGLTRDVGLQWQEDLKKRRV